jgi:hypothetical protein
MGAAHRLENSSLHLCVHESQARIKAPVAEVNDKIDDRKYKRSEDDDAENDRHITPDNRPNGDPAKSGAGKHAFDENGTAEE